MLGNIMASVNDILDILVFVFDHVTFVEVLTIRHTV